MARTLTPDVPRAVLAGIATVVVLLVPRPGRPSWSSSPAACSAGGSCGGSAPAAAVAGPGRTGSRAGVALLAVFGVLLLGLPIAVRLVESQALAVADAFYRSGALVFGGGHVVLPLLSDAVVTPGWVGEDRFLAGYGAAQAVPGPLFSFAGFLGASMTTGPTGVPGADPGGGGDLPAVIPAGLGHAAVLGSAARLAEGRCGARAARMPPSSGSCWRP